MSHARPDVLAAFCRDLPAGLDGGGIAARLYAALDNEREAVGIADVWHYGFSVEIELVNGEFWAIECLGPDAFHFYPGIVRDEGVTWLNVWVAPDLSLDELAKRVNEVAAAAGNGMKT